MSLALLTRKGKHGGCHRRASPALVSAVAALVLLVTMAISVQMGAAGISMNDTKNVIFAHLGLPSSAVSAVTDSIVWELRVPRVLTAAFVGACLALCGVTLQALTSNPLAEPYLLGISSGASAGAIIAVVVGVNTAAFGITGGALLGALASLLLLLMLLRRSGLDSVRVVLTGVVTGQLFAALGSLILMGGGDAEATRAITFWMLGSLGSARWSAVVVCSIGLGLAVTVMGWHSSGLDALALGPDTASSLGINVARVRLVLLIIVSVVTASAVANVGAIGFVGLIVPHAVRFLVGSRHRGLLPASAITGAVLLVITDAVCRVVFAPREVPVGVITALIGVPVFLAIMKKRGDL